MVKKDKAERVHSPPSLRRHAKANARSMYGSQVPFGPWRAIEREVVDRNGNPVAKAATAEIAEFLAMMPELIDPDFR